MFCSAYKERFQACSEYNCRFYQRRKKLVESGKMNANTFPNYIKPIKGLLEANSVALHWKSPHKLYPRPKQTTILDLYKKEI